MLNKLFGFLIVMFVAAEVGVVSAQPAQPGAEAEMPEVQQPEANEGDSGLMSGEKPFTLMVDDEVGELIYVYDEETKELESITAKRGVIFASEDMTLNSDEMEYQTLNSSLVATGKRVVVRMGEMIITCQVFKYNPETQEGDFTGKPILYQRDKEGKVTSSGGHTISVVNVNGKFQMRIGGGGGGTRTFIKSSGNAKNQPVERKTLAPGEKPARMTLNNSPSGLAVSPVSPGTTQSNSNSNSIIPMPSVKQPVLAPDTTDSVPEVDGVESQGSAGRIDPNNPSDVKKMSDEKQ